MLSTNLLSGLKHFRSALCSRNIGIVAPSFQKATDPIQQLFLDKIREYKQKSTGGKLVEPSPEIQKELQDELHRVTLQFGGAEGEDMSKFPTFTWKDPEIDPINTATDKPTLK